MKLIIDINDNEYMGIKGYPNNITSYPVTIHIYDAIRKGIPLEDAIDKIREEIVHLHDWAFDREEILRIIDKYKAESEA